MAKAKLLSDFDAMVRLTDGTEGRVRDLVDAGKFRVLSGPGGHGLIEAGTSNGFVCTKALAEKVTRWLAPLTNAEKVGLGVNRVHMANINFMGKDIESGKVTVVERGIVKQADAVQQALAVGGWVALDPPSKWAVFTVEGKQSNPPTTGPKIWGGTHVIVRLPNSHRAYNKIVGADSSRNVILKAHKVGGSYIMDMHEAAAIPIEYLERAKSLGATVPRGEYTYSLPHFSSDAKHQENREKAVALGILGVPKSNPRRRRRGRS